MRGLGNLRTRLVVALVTAVALPAVAADRAAALGVSCTYGSSTLTIRFGVFSGSTAKIASQFFNDDIVITDGGSAVTCSGGTPKRSTTSTVAVIDDVADGNQTLQIDTPETYSAQTFGLNLGTGTDVLAFTNAGQLSLGRGTGGVLANFNTKVDTDNEIASSSGVDRVTAEGQVDAAQLRADGSVNGAGVTPLDLPVSFRSINVLAGASTLVGGSAADTLTGSDRADTISGGAGDDVIAPGKGDDTVDGGAGLDTLSYAGVGTPVTADLAAGTATGSDVGTDSAVGFERAVGGDGNDTLSGTDGPNRLDGAGGDDTLNGRAGADELLGGAGTDAITYASAAGPVKLDLAVAGPQAGAEGDTVSGVETVFGSPFADTLSGSDGAETFDPGAGSDTVDARGGNDVIGVRDGTSDTVTCGAGSDSVTADVPGTDTIAADCEARDLADAPPPDTTITGGPPASGLAKTASFTFTGTGNSPAFECRLDAEGFSACASPKSYAALTLGAHTFQVRAKGLDGDLDATPATATFTVLPSDNDKDGSTEDKDCDDNDPKRHPGAKEIVGNRVDEDCSGADTPFGRVVSPISFGVRAGSTTRLTRLTVSSVLAGARITLRCSGPKRSCPFKTKARSFKKAAKKTDLASLLKRRGLKPKTVLEIEVSAPNRISKVTRLTIRKGKTPTVKSLCRVPGGKIASCG